MSEKKRKKRLVKRKKSQPKKGSKVQPFAFGGAKLTAGANPMYKARLRGKDRLMMAPATYDVYTMPGTQIYPGTYLSPKAGNGPVYYNIFPYTEGGRSGREGVRIVCRGPIARFWRDGVASGAGVWCTYNNPSSNANSTLAAGASFGINPYDVLPRSSPAASLGESYARFQFTKLKFCMEGLMAANQASCFAMVYFPDGAADWNDSTYATAVTQPYFKNFPFWVDSTFDVTPALSAKDWFYTDKMAVPLNADDRQIFQGSLFMYPNSNLTSAVSQDCGILYVEAEFILFDATPYNQDIVMNSLRHHSLRSKMGDKSLLSSKATRLRVRSEAPSLPVGALEPRPETKEEDCEYDSKDQVRCSHEIPPATVGSPLRPKQDPPSKPRQREDILAEVRELVAELVAHSPSSGSVQE